MSASGAHQRSYYGQPILKPPVWASRDIAGYLFLGGLAGGSSILAALADLAGEEDAALRLKVAVALSGTAAGAALVHDLGRPSRFANMLRVFKPTSPMSIGSWLLALYGPVAGISLASAATRRAAAGGRAASLSAAVLGAGVASYTAVLICDTAVPAWQSGYREMPFLFVSSAASAASGLALVALPAGKAPVTRRAARRLGSLGALVEVVAERAVERREEALGEAFTGGTAGLFLRAACAASVGGAVGAVVIPSRSRTGAAVSGCLLLAGSCLMRFGLFHAGVASTTDPKYVVATQGGPRPGERSENGRAKLR